jgi:hypothetical protein
MNFVIKVGGFFSDMTNAGMVIEAIGVFLVAKYGIPRNNDASPHDTVVISKSGEDLNAAMKMLKALTRRERLGFTLMVLGISLMLLDRNLS